MSVASSDEGVHNTCRADEIERLINPRGRPGPIQRMECLKCVLRGAELIADYDRIDRESQIKALKAESDLKTEMVNALSGDIEFLDNEKQHAAEMGESTVAVDARIAETMRNRAQNLERIRQIKAEIDELTVIASQGGKSTMLITALQQLEAYLGTSVKEVNITEDVAKQLIASFLHHASAHAEVDIIVDLSKNSLSSHALSTISGYFQGLAAAEIINGKLEQSKVDAFYNTAELSAESEMIPPLRILNYLAQAGLKPIFVGELFGMHISSDVRKVVGVWAGTNQSKAPVSPSQILSLYLKPRPFTLLNILPISFNDFLAQGKRGKKTDDKSEDDVQLFSDLGGEEDD